MAEPNKYVSMEPEDFVVGGLLSDADVRCTEFRATYYDYDGKVAEPVVAIRGTLYPLDKDGNVGEGVKPQIQYWSFGNHTDYAPSEDGRGVIPTGTAEAGRQNSNWHIFLKSLRDCGMQKGAMATGDLGVLDNMDFHCMQVPAPKRSGLDSAPAEGERQKTVMIAQKVIRWPGQAAKPASKAAAKPRANAAPAPVATAPAPATPAPAAAAAAAAAPAAARAVAPGPGPVASAPEGEDPNTVAKSLLDQILSQNSGIVQRNDLKMAAFRALGTSKAALRNAVVALVSDDAFLSEQGCEVQPDAVMRA